MRVQPGERERQDVGRPSGAAIAMHVNAANAQDDNIGFEDEGAKSGHAVKKLV